jgi:hypothetical protein
VVPSLDDFLQRRVVLDTGGPVIYIGQLAALDARGYWLTDADVHDRSEGHATNEEYINEAHLLERSGHRTINRRRVFVERTAVISISALDDVASDDAGPDTGAWTP